MMKFRMGLMVGMMGILGWALAMPAQAADAVPAKKSSSKANKKTPAKIAEAQEKKAGTLYDPKPFVPKNLRMDPPATKKERDNQLKRSADLIRFKTLGYIGESSDGLLAIREKNGASKEEAVKVQKIVDEENKDRAAIYKELISFNKLDEKEQGFLMKAVYDTLKGSDAKGFYFYENQKWQKKY